MKRVGFLTALCGLVLIAAVGGNPRYLEELCVGGGAGDPVDGGADIEADGDFVTDGGISAAGDVSAGEDGTSDHSVSVTAGAGYGASLGLFESDANHGGEILFDGATDTLRIGTRDGSATMADALQIGQGSAHVAISGDLAVNGGDVNSSQDTLRLNPDGSGRLECLGASGKLRLCNDAVAQTSQEFRMWNDANALTMYGGIYCTIADSTAGSEDGRFALALREGGSLKYDRLQLDSSGNMTIPGDMTVTGADISSSSDPFSIKPGSAGYMDIWGAGGKLRLYRKAVADASLAFYMWNSSDSSAPFGELFFVNDVSTDGSEDGKFSLCLMSDGAMGYNRLVVDSGGKGTFLGDVAANGGEVSAGKDGVARGTLTVWDGAGGNAPGCVRLASPNGTEWYVFAEDDGTLKVCSALPTQNSDGNAVGGQAD